MPINVPNIVMDGWPTKPARGMAKALKETLIGGALAWHREFSPKHFAPGAAAKYGYKKRTSRYVIRKLKKIGTRLPLVFTGLTRKQMRRVPKATGTSKKGRITMTVPWYIRLNRKKASAPDLGAEILRITKSETRELLAAMEQRLAERLNAVKGRKNLAA